METPECLGAMKGENVERWWARRWACGQVGAGG
jgi:hypothetical protein